MPLNKESSLAESTSSFQPLSAAPARRPITYGAALHHRDEEMSPKSDPKTRTDGDPDASSSFQWSWKMKMKQMDDSDDDMPARSPAQPHPISTPKSRRSSTPPTSEDDEMPAQIMPLARAKGKGKVPALRFDEPAVPNDRRRLSDRLLADPVKVQGQRQRLSILFVYRLPRRKSGQETVLDRGRLAAAQKVSLQRADNPSKRLGLHNFFLAVQSTTTSALGKAPSSDPILPFSSSPGEQRTASTSALPVPEPAVIPFSRALISTDAELPALDDDSDEENLPDVGALLDGVKHEKTMAERQKELMALKMRALAAANNRSSAVDDDDDDLEITGSSEMKVKDEVYAEQGSASKKRASEGRKRQMMAAGISLTKQNAKPATPSQNLARATMTQEELSKFLAKRVKEENEGMTKAKEDEWVRRGGKRAAIGGDAEELIASRSAALKEIAENGPEECWRRERLGCRWTTTEEDASDEDWHEDRGSATMPDVEDAGDEDITMVDENNDDEEEDDEARGRLKTRAPRRTRAVIDSDSENEENAPPLRKSSPDENHPVSPVDLIGIIHRGSVSSSMDERTEDEGDKENNTSLMYDRSEDKENRAVPRHPLGGARPALGRQGSLFGLEEGMRRGLSMSPGDRDTMTDIEDENDENDAGGDKRRPLQNLLSDEDPFSTDAGPSTRVDFAARLQQASPLPDQPVDAPALTLQPSFDAGLRLGARAGGFSQFSDEGSPSFGGAPLQPGFSDLFEAGTERQRRPLGLSSSFSEKSESGLFGLRKTSVSLGLTQDVDLQPAFEVGDNLKRQADSIFQKEQEYVWEAANRKSETKRQELYVKDNGFLTQTRPDEDDPEIYIPSSPAQSVTFGTQKSTLLEPQSELRRPLRTLSLTEPAESDAPERSPLRRLAKRTTTPPPRSNRSTPSPTPAMRTKNAFDALRRDTLGIKAPRPKKPLEKSDFVAEEAQESDDDEMLGIGRKVDDGDEEDGEDMDRTLRNASEHAQEDDLKNEMLQQAVVQGDLRKKRRNRGLGLDDSDDEEEEDMRARKMRRGLNEPRIDNDDIKELAKDPKTLPFYQVYSNDLSRDDDQELAYLQQETQLEGPQDAEMESDDQDDREVLTTKELTERLREAARQEQAQAELDPHDVSWLDNDDSDEENQTKIKTVSVRRTMEQRQYHDMESRNGAVESATDKSNRERLHGWAKLEGRSRNLGTARASGRNAVTSGGQMAKAKAGGGSLRLSAQSGASKPSEARKPLKAQPSVLMGVASDRSTRFV
ncbi:hypothetical protein C8J57DRAFT_1292655 [Mycena rebaudengoi]|nr:hypothetical protein C8J57DRAFT_1292655 [Mycena rebaudengoi]